MGWGEAHDKGTGTTAQIEEAHGLLDEYGTPPGPLGKRIAAALEDIKAKITSGEGKEPSKARTKEEFTERMMNILESEKVRCVLAEPKNWACVICSTKIHAGGQGCPCATCREKDFGLNSLCSQCAAVYDNLLVNDQAVRIMKQMLRKYYYEAHGTFAEWMGARYGHKSTETF